jgi:hypothetical protein
MDPFQAKVSISFGNILYGIFHDWVPHLPLIITSVILLIVLPIISKFKKNAFILIGVFILPIGGLYLFCKLLDISHFVTSRYLINFLPLFFVTLYLSIEALEIKFEKLKRLVRIRLLFIVLLVASNLVILPFYYRSEKQDFRGLVNYLKSNLKQGDKIFVVDVAFLTPVLYYFKILPETRHYVISFRRISEREVEFRKPFIYENKTFTIFHSSTCCSQYLADGNRLWIIAGKGSASEIKKNTPFILKGYFDGSFLNFNKFPTDASIYLFLWDPQSPDEKGMDMPIE